MEPAASRYYYALFQAAVHRLTALGWTPGRLASGAVEWTHTSVQNNILLARGRRSDRELFTVMRRMREKADYGEFDVDHEPLAAHVAAVREFVEQVTR